MNGLSIGDGFKFGCGFFLAGFIAWLVMVIFMVLFSVVFGGLLGGLLSDFGDLGDFSRLLPLLIVV
ncbi:MAG: hypothetical protein B6I34_04020 [Anaerolineaceae bacterium 4572_32.1]|nr:MAG: hypothetical protein B6I34_04020 [Anaerolineaceae bacterium 4572_32.1]